jgi:hypothetical protein
MDDLDLADLLDPAYVPPKSYSNLLAEGIWHNGGLAMLAAAEKIAYSHPALAGLMWCVATSK